jgi:hypothetical protein
MVASKDPNSSPIQTSLEPDEIPEQVRSCMRRVPHPIVVVTASSPESALKKSTEVGRRISLAMAQNMTDINIEQ